MVFFLTFLVLVGFACGAPAYAKGKHGIYEGELIIQALPDGRNLRIVKPLSYVDPEGRRWRVPQGMETDGASVPRFFWALFPPFSGKYRIAAVVHDRYCQTRSRAWRAVHRMFYEAMLAAGVDQNSANIMYGAVYAFGPRWSMTGPNRAPKKPNLSNQDQQKAFQALQFWIIKNKPTPREIERHVNRIRLRQLGSKAAR